ncbi:MAG: diguanylate cyclase [Rhodocyclaceae bacterium]|nr:diguanylate cyclase [Rhodocyclaceae bacterium]
MTSNTNFLSALDLTRYEQLKATGELPSPKGAALAIIRLTRKDDCSLAELAHAIKADPAFVGRLIKTANSVQAGARRAVASIHDALNILGIPAVRSLALSFSLVSNYRGGACANFDYGRFWSRSLVCAIAFQTMAVRTRAAPADEAFSVGLLARVGELALATLFPAEYSALLAAGNGGKTLIQRESDAFALNHAEMTAAMMLDWGLPRLFVEPVFEHESPDALSFEEGSRGAKLALSLALSAAIADICLAAEGERRGLMAPLLRLGGRLSIESEELLGLCDRVAEEWREWGGMLDISTAELPPFDELTSPPSAPAFTISHSEHTEQTHPMRILVVDDDRTMRALEVALLREAGHEVFEAENGVRGYELALELRPQIMIIDWIMPEMDGIELTRTLRRAKIGRNIYILILTSLEDEAKVVEAFEAGVDDFMSKPLKSRVLAARLRAGQRVIQLQEEIERDREEIRHFAAELAVTNRRLQEFALTDPLTGLPNRRFAMERMEQEWAAATRSQRSISCMVVDVDRFKQINDTYGHDVGDRVLKGVSAAMKGALRTQDVLCRMGGDEFFVVCADTSLASALVCAERMRVAVAELELRDGNQRIPISISVGVAQRELAMTDIDGLIKRADQGVYQAKHQGRNQVGTVQRAGLDTRKA